jgi:hypothetical protein
MQYCNHRHFAELNLVEGPVPETRMGNALSDVSLFQFRQVEARREMLTVARDQHGADVLRQRCEELLDADDRLVIERIALLRPIEFQHGHAAMPFGGKRCRQLRGEALGRHSLAHNMCAVRQSCRHESACATLSS